MPSTVVRSLGYSDSGNTASDDRDDGSRAWTLTYDSSDRLVEVAQGGSPIGEYLHNAMGQRVAKTVGAGTTHYVYDLSGNLIGEAGEATGLTQREYIWLGGRPLAYVTGGAIYYVHPDHLGTPAKLTDAAGAVVWTGNFRPFGETDSGAGGSVTFNLRFPGQYADAETGLYYNGFRDYDASLGRYIQSDPIGLRGGWNTYAYVSGNPVTRVDLTGLLMQICCRPINQAVVGWFYDHCYISIDGETIGMYPQPATPPDTGDVGGIFPNDDRDVGGQCETCPADPPCGGGPADKPCTDQAASGYPIGEYHYKGPNSNTFAAYVWGSCCGQPFPERFRSRAKGWNSHPPEPA
jgi:RHS repeat-associated protein